MKIKSRLMIGTLLLSGIAFAQDSGKTYIVTEIQGLKLKVKQDQAIIAQKDLAAAQANFNIAVAALNEESEKVKKDNKWPEDLVFNQSTLLYSEAPKPKPKEEPKK